MTNRGVVIAPTTEPVSRMLTRSLASMLAFTLPSTTTDFADNSVLTFAGWTHRQDMLPQLDRSVDLAVNDEVLAPCRR